MLLFAGAACQQLPCCDRVPTAQVSHGTCSRHSVVACTQCGTALSAVLVVAHSPKLLQGTRTRSPRGRVQLTDKPKNTRGANTTAVSLGNNYGMPLLWAALADKSATWLQCLQNSGAFLPHPVCKCALTIYLSPLRFAACSALFGIVTLALLDSCQQPVAYCTISCATRLTSRRNSRNTLVFLNTVPIVAVESAGTTGPCRSRRWASRGARSSGATSSRSRRTRPARPSSRASSRCPSRATSVRPPAGFYTARHCAGGWCTGAVLLSPRAPWGLPCTPCTCQAVTLLTVPRE